MRARIERARRAGRALMQMGVILPTTKLYGGVKRFLELGNIFLRRGHGFTVFSPEGSYPSWFDYRGRTDTVANAAKQPLDALFATETEYARELIASVARVKVFYCVSESQASRLKPVLADPSISVFVNSTSLFELVRRKHGIVPFKALGGVDCELFRQALHEPSTDEFRVLAYGRLHRRGKGTDVVVKACEWLYRRTRNVRLVLFDSPVDEHARKLIEGFECEVPFEFVIDHPVAENHKIFRKADVFVAAERKAGWSNTCAEAMASGLAVVATKAGTKDFLDDGVTGLVVRRHWWFVARALRKLADRPDLRATLAKNGFDRIQRYTWESLADGILDYVGNTP